MQNLQFAVFISLIGSSLLVAGEPIHQEACEWARAKAHRLSECTDYRDIDFIEDNIYIGNICAASDLKLLSELGITHIISAAVEWDPVFPDHFEYYNVSSPLKDDHHVSVSWFAGASTYIHSVVEMDPEARVLVHCNMGMSRSVALSVLYLMELYGVWDADLVLQTIQEYRPCAQPNPAYMKMLRSWRGEKTLTVLV